MPNNEGLLPRGFESLEPFVEDWALERESDRMRRRWSSELGEIRRFYDAMMTQADSALAHLDAFELDELPERERRLLNLTLSLVEIGHVVEVYGMPGVPHGLPPERMNPSERV